MPTKGGLTVQRWQQQKNPIKRHVFLFDLNFNCIISFL